MDKRSKLPPTSKTRAKQSGAKPYLKAAPKSVKDKKIDPRPAKDKMYAPKPVPKPSGKEKEATRGEKPSKKKGSRAVKVASAASNVMAPGSGKIVKAIGSTSAGKKIVIAGLTANALIGLAITAAIILVVVLPGFMISTFYSGLSLPQKMALDAAQVITKQDGGASGVELDTLGSDTKDFSAMPVSLSSAMLDKDLQDGNGGFSDANLPEGDAAAVIKVAKHWVGVPYVWGGVTPKGWDCSGFTMGVYRTALGLVLPHYSGAQASKGREVPLSEAKPGDLMVSASHVMIFLGKADGGKVYTIHSPKPGGKVNIGLRSASYASQFKYYRMFNNTATTDYIPSASELAKGSGESLPTYQLNAFDNWAISNGYFTQTSSKAYPKESVEGSAPAPETAKAFFKGVIEVKPAALSFASSVLPFSPSPAPSESPSESADSSPVLSASSGTERILGTGVGPMHIKEGVLDTDKAKSLSFSNRFLSCVVDRVSPSKTDPFRFSSGWKKADKDRKIINQKEYDNAKKAGSKVLQMLPLDGIDEAKAGQLYDKASKWYNGQQVSKSCEADEVTTSSEQEDASKGGQVSANGGAAIKVTEADGKERALSGEEYAFVSQVASKVGGTDMSVEQRVGAIEWAILHTNAKDKADGFLEKLKTEWDSAKTIGENVYKAAGDLSAGDYDSQEAPARQLAGSGATSITKCGSVGGPGCAGGQFNKDRPLDDKAVYGGPGMTQEEIQAFLEKKGSWLAKNKVPTNTKTSDKFCKGYESSGQELPSEIIYKTAKSCDVKAQWILVRLQAEQGLVSKKTQGNLRSAMGYGCPDGGACAAEYYGFFNQVWWASRQVQNYRIGSFKDALPIGKATQDLSGEPYTPKNNAARVLYLYTPHTGVGKDGNGGGAKSTFDIYKGYFPCSSLDEKGDGEAQGQNVAFKDYFEAVPTIGNKSQEEAFEASPIANEYGWDGKFSKPYAGPNPKVTSPYGYRIHPVTGQRKKHNGVDLQAAQGVPQYAAAPGIVEFAKPYSTCGNAVKIKHGEHAGHQWSTMHCHLSSMNVKAGQKVEAGTKIGLTGATGRVTGAHIHFEVQQDGVAIEPTQFIFNGKEATPQEGMSNDGGSADGSNNGGLSSEEVKIAHAAWIACGGKVPVSSDSSPSLAPIPGQQEATIPDPTTKNGKITPRMKKFYDEAAKAGFGNPPKGIGCWRPTDTYAKWHPRGNACDYMFAAGTPATGKALEDGNKFAQWAIDNSDRLEVYYLIWQGKMWTRSSGKWKQYGGYGGANKQNATTGHYDHVHVNVYP